MQMVQIVCCPNCGSPAERYHSEHSHSPSEKGSSSIRTQCNHCDYLMVTCAQTGRVLEAYAPGIPFVASVRSKSVEAVPVSPMLNPTVEPIVTATETRATVRKPHPLLTP